MAVIQKTLELFTTALSLVAALAWNDAIQSVFKLFFVDAASLLAKFIYAIIITLIIVIMSSQISRLNKILAERSSREKKPLSESS